MIEPAVFNLRLVAARSEYNDRCKLIQRSAKTFGLLLLLLGKFGNNEVKFYIGVRGNPASITLFLISVCGFDPREREEG